MSKCRDFLLNGGTQGGSGPNGTQEVQDKIELLRRCDENRQQGRAQQELSLAPGPTWPNPPASQAHKFCFVFLEFLLILKGLVGRPIWLSIRGRSGDQKNFQQL